MPGNELTLPDSHPNPTLMHSDLTTAVPSLPATFSSLITTGNIPLQPEALPLNDADFVFPSPLWHLPTTQSLGTPDFHDRPCCSQGLQLTVTESLDNALQKLKEDQHLMGIKVVLDDYPELPASERGQMGAQFWLKRRGNHSAESMAEAFGISKALLYRQIAITAPAPEELVTWVDTYMQQHHPGKSPAELTNQAKIQLTRTYFDNTTPALCTPLWKLSALLGTSGYSLRNQIKKQLAMETSQSATNSLSNDQPAAAAVHKTRVHDRTFYHERDKYLQDTLIAQLQKDYPGKTIADLSADERRQLAISYWQDQTVKPSLQRLAELTQTNRRTLVNRIQQIKSAPGKLSQWVEDQRRHLPADIQARYNSDKTLRLDLAMEFWSRIPPELHAKKWQLANAMEISPPSLSTRYRRLHLMPESVISRLNEALAQRCAVLQKDSLSDQERALTGATLWLSELSAQIAEKALARQLDVDEPLLHRTIAELRVQARARSVAAKRKITTPPPEETRSVSPGPLITDSMGRPKKNQKNSVKKILKEFGLKAIRAMPLSRKKTISHKHVQATMAGAIPEVKLEAVSIPPEPGVEMVICGENGEIINSIVTAQRPLAKSFVIRNDLPILRDPLNPEKSLTLPAGGVTNARQLEVSYWGDLKLFAKKHPKTEINKVVQQARDLVAMEGQQLAAYMERLMICHESFAEDAQGSLVALGQGVFNASGQLVPAGTVLGIVAGKFFPGNDSLTLTRKQGSRNSLSHTWNSGSWENSVNSFHDRNLLAMLNCAALPGKPAVAKNNVGCFTLGQEGNLICYFTISPVAANQEYYIDYGKDYDPALAISQCQQDERIDKSIDRVVHQGEVKPEPGEPDETPPSATAHAPLSPYQHRLISDVYNSQNWQEKSAETLMRLLSQTRIFNDNKAVLVVVNDKYHFLLAWDSLTSEKIMPQQLTGRRLAVIQHSGNQDTGQGVHYHAFLRRNANEEMQFIRYSNDTNYALAYSSCERMIIPPSGFSLTHAAWVALTGKNHDMTQGECLRQQLIDIIQSDAYKSQGEGTVLNAKAMEQ